MGSGGIGTGLYSLYGAVYVALTDESNNAMLVKCATGDIPSAVAGYAIGCHLIDTTTGLHYCNTGTASSCSFTSIGVDSAGDIALANTKVIVGNADGIGAAWALSSDVSMNNTGSVTVNKIKGVALGTTTATSGNILVADGTDWETCTTSGDVTVASGGAMTIGAAKVSGAKMTSLKNYGCVAVTLTGTSNANVFGATNGFASTITGVTVLADSASTATVTVKTGAGNICTVAVSDTAGDVTGPTSALTNTSLTSAGTCVVVSDSALSTVGKVFITFTVA